MKPLGSLKKGSSFLIPWQHNDAGSCYLYRVSRINEDGTILVFNKDLRTYSKYNNTLNVIEL